MQKPKIVTIGISPAWDVTLHGDNIDWGRHMNIQAEPPKAAGKALNICRGLAWLGMGSVAAGFWQDQDYAAMMIQTHQLGIEPAYTKVPGQTRTNYTIMDTASGREMHLRTEKSPLSLEDFEKLKGDLAGTILGDCICVFSGSMAAEYIEDISSIIQTECGDNFVAVDSSEEALDQLLDTDRLDLITPNMQEFSTLVGSDVANETDDIIEAARPLLARCPMILVTRGAKGAVLITGGKAWSSISKTDEKVINTVGCGDYLMAGFLAGLSENLSLADALTNAVKTATAKAYGMTENISRQEAEEKIEVETELVCEF